MNRNAKSTILYLNKNKEYSIFWEGTHTLPTEIFTSLNQVTLYRLHYSSRSLRQRLTTGCLYVPYSAFTIYRSSTRSPQ